MKPQTDTRAVRITQQFRSGGAMVYDLLDGTSRLTLRVTGLGGASDGPPAEWRIEASMGAAPEALVVSEQAGTRADALRAVGVTWTTSRTAHSLPLFDWESVAEALRAVRAI